MYINDIQKQYTMSLIIVLLATASKGFVSDFGLYRRQTSQQGTILVPGLVVPGHLVPFFRPGHLVPLFGSPRPIFYNGF